VDDAGDLAFELGFDRNDEAFAANGDEVFGAGLRGALFAELACGAAKALFNGPMLSLHRTADAAQLGAGVVGE
jgi:hypothetical protein